MFQICISIPPSFAFASVRMAGGPPSDKYTFLYPTDSSLKSKSRVSSMNPVYSPVQPGTPYGNPKTMAYTGYPAGYPTAAPAYTPSLYQTGSPGYPPGYTTGTPYKVPPSQSNGAPPPYSPSPSTYPSAMYPIRSAYPQQNLYTQGAYYTQPVYAAQPHVIHHTTVVQPNSIPSALYPAPVPPVTPRPSALTMGMVAGTTMAMSAAIWMYFMINESSHSKAGIVFLKIRNAVDHTPAHSHRSTPCYGANVSSARNAWLQLCATSLVEPTCQSYLELNVVCKILKCYTGSL
ncbi:hypothetical protein QTP70_034568 [Hemibagrus guttatus]|uniref:Uncharacterized protein n=2 Tax=Siluroidei TaxID=1489793 RepID=A0AAE0RC05_9TELE|nr:hypothetical protein QTP70_034568 [Hemibagrus guttatus]